MNKIITGFLCPLLLVACIRNAPETRRSLSAGGPIQLLPENPHYFLYKGKALALISSAEHYGAVLNPDFDFQVYLKALYSDGMNYTRIFAGTYFEIPAESFGIKHNTLAPAKGRVITPWVAVTQESGRIKYDLSAWNEDYFKRMKAFLALASQHNIIVEVTLFSSIYNDNQWNICPQNPINTTNIKHEINRHDVHTLNNGDLFTFQESLVRKMVNELNDFDNFFFEIQNEPWADRAVPVYNIVNKEELKINDWTYKADFGDEASLAWQEKIAGIITEEESGLPKKHLIAQNYTNYKAPIPAVSDHVSIINFHYAWPEAAGWNYHYDKVIGSDESGFSGSEDKPYRRQAWQFMLSGGGLFNNLDYSFFAGHEDGSGEYSAPGGGSKRLRQQLKILSDFLHTFELRKLHPDVSCIKSSAGLIPYALSDGEKNYAVFLRAIGTAETTLQLWVENGNYHIQTLNTITGSYTDRFKLKSQEGILKIAVKIPDGELALRITGTK